MKFTLKHLTVGALACAGLLIGLARNADAKAAWESHAGGEAYDAAKGGMIQTPDGGFVTVGETSSFTRAGDYDVYVVKNDICGSFVWGYTYNVGGGNDYGRRIRQTPDGGYIITGETENLKNCCTRNDAFLMKLTEDGQVEWTKTYGGKLDDKGADVELYYKEKGYLIAGRTNSFGAGSYDGWLIATDLNGSVIWSRVYGGSQLDGFNGLTQSRNGDIVATGETRSYARLDPIIIRPTSDLWIVRTNDAGHVAWSFHYGGRATDVGYEVIEAPEGYGDIDSDLIVCGYSKSVSPKCEAYLLRVQSTGAYRVDHLYGAGNGSDEFRDLVTVPGSDDIYAVGRLLKPGNGFGGFDVFTVSVNSKLNLNWAMVHGGKDNDEGYAVAADMQQGGLGWAGSTFSFTFGKEDMYMGLAFPWGEDFCHDATPELADDVPKYGPLKAPTGEPQVSVECDAKVEAIPNDSYKIICSTCFGGGGGVQEPSGNGDLSQHIPFRNTEGVAIKASMTGTPATVANR